MQNYVQRGDTLTFVPPRAVASGDGVQIGALFGVASYPADPSLDPEVEVEVVTVGVFTLPRTGAALNPGDPVFWDDSNKVVSGTGGTGLLRIGIATTAAAADSPTADVRLNGSF